MARQKHSWAVDISCVSGQTLEITSKRSAHFKSDDRIIGFRRPVSFLWDAEITRAYEAEPVGDDFYIHRYDLSSLNKYEVPRDLLDLSFSLRFVYNYRNPRIHFRRRYRSLDKSDFEVIKRGIVFWPRTMLGIFLNELPISITREFIANQIEDGRATIDGPSDYLYIWNELRELIVYKYIVGNHYLQSIEKNLIDDEGKTIVGDFHFEQIQVDTDRGLEERGDLISVQANRLNDLENSLLLEDDIQLFEVVDQRIRDSEIPKWLVDSFRGAAWPIVTI